MKRYVGIAILAFSVLSCSLRKETAIQDRGEHSHKITKHHKSSLFTLSEKGFFGIELVPGGDEFVVGDNAAEVIIHDDNDKDVWGADIKIEPWMPVHNHGLPDDVAVVEKGRGIYLMENLNLPMDGRWELRIEVSKNGRIDSGVIYFETRGEHASHLTSHQASLLAAVSSSDMKMPSTKKSMAGFYVVSYESEENPLPLNKIHSWTVDVKTSDGNSLSDANIAVEGLMPAHGHGFPTMPRATENLGDGRYLVEGIKFHMPGHWIVSFKITEGQTSPAPEDAVSFDLMVK